MTLAHHVSRTTVRATSSAVRSASFLALLLAAAASTPTKLFAQGAGRPQLGNAVRQYVAVDTAVMALTHKIVVIAWNLLSTGALYDDPGAAAVRTSTIEQQRRRAIRQLETLGLTVTIEPRIDPGAA